MSEIFFVVSELHEAVSVTKPAMDSLARSEALRQYLRKACNALDFKESKLQSSTLDYMIYDDIHRAIYCYIPKVRKMKENVRKARGRKVKDRIGESQTSNAMLMIIYHPEL